jgi:hypothetical protein
MGVGVIRLECTRIGRVAIENGELDHFFVLLSAG